MWLKSRFNIYIFFLICLLSFSLSLECIKTHVYIIYSLSVTIAITAYIIINFVDHCYFIKAALDDPGCQGEGPLCVVCFAWHTAHTTGISGCVDDMCTTTGIVHKWSRDIGLVTKHSSFGIPLHRLFSVSELSFNSLKVKESR